MARNEHWVAFVPEAARWPYEVRIFPVARVPDLPALGEAARDAFGPLYLDVLRRFDGLFGGPLRTSPRGTRRRWRTRRRAG